MKQITCSRRCGMIWVWRNHADKMASSVRAAKRRPDQREASRRGQVARWAQPGAHEAAAARQREVRARMKRVREMLQRQRAKTEPAAPVDGPSRERLMAGR